MEKKIDLLEGDSFYRELDDSDIKTVKEIVTWILKAYKSYGLYPKNHSIPQNSVLRVKTALNTFLINHEELRFVVKMDRLIFQGEVVHVGQPEEDNLAFLLFRDGIHWIEFHKGIEHKELIDLFEILNENKVIMDKTEGDLVTALWEKNFPHLQYEAQDLLWDDTPLIDFSNLNKTEDEQTSSGQEELLEQREERVSIADTKVDPALWKLTPEEIKILHKRVRDYESVENQDDVLDVLCIILETQNHPEDFASILVFLKKEFQNVLEQGEFVFASKFLRNIKELNTFVKDQKPWASKQIRNFYTQICGSTYLDLLAPHWKILDIDKSNQTTAFFQYLRSLPPDVIPDLMPILLKTRSPRILRRLIKIVQALANRNIIPLKKLLYHPDKALVKRVIYILGLLKNKESKELLHELIYHPLESIRKEALKSLVADDPEMLQKMFRIIDDSSLAVRQLILDYLGKHRRETNENLLLDYLANRKYKFKDTEHILACYKTLGRCGSGHSIPFLQSTLFSKPWISLLRFRPSLHRKGAARALFELDIEEASEILASGSKSLFPNIRRACRYAYKGKR